jgi:signal transduction histidine kinase
VAERNQFLDNRNRLAELEREVSELKAVSLLVGGLAHDFNNLLTAIAGHAALLEAEAPPGSEVQESAGAILRAAEHASVLAQKLQGVARRGSSRREPVDLHRIIEEVAGLVRPSRNGRIEIRKEFTAPAAITLADPEQMHQMLLNLALNAREAMPDGGTLSFSTSVQEGPPTGRRLVLTVRDTGCGVPASDRQRIFEPFFTTRQRSGGTGLGLTVVSGIVKRHNGRIEVDSVEGAGTTFRIYLPLLETAARAVG